MGQSLATLTRGLGRLGGTGLAIDRYALAVCDQLRRSVPFTFGCLASIDPATGLITGAVKTADTGMGDEEFAHYEYAVDDVNHFDDIAGRRIPAGVLSLDTGGRPEASSRFAEFLSPRFGFTDELRVAFRSQQHTWAVLAIYRSGEGPASFSADDARLLAAVSGPVAVGVRRSLFQTAATVAEVPDGPAVVIVGPDDRVRSVSAAGRRRIDELGGWQHGSLPTTLLALLNAARRGRFPATRVRTGAGWLVARAAALGPADGPGSEVVITLDGAGPGELTSLALAAFGLTAREEEVARLVLQGASTAVISRSLFLSPHTVQDHLKKVFAKVGVGSRRELIATVFFGHHAPHLGAVRRTDGSLVPPAGSTG